MVERIVRSATQHRACQTASRRNVCILNSQRCAERKLRPRRHCPPLHVVKRSHRMQHSFEVVSTSAMHIHRVRAQPLVNVLVKKRKLKATLCSYCRSCGERDSMEGETASLKHNNRPQSIQFADVSRSLFFYLRQPRSLSLCVSVIIFASKLLGLPSNLASTQGSPSFVSAIVAHGSISDPTWKLQSVGRSVTRPSKLVHRRSLAQTDLTVPQGSKVSRVDRSWRLVIPFLPAPGQSRAHHPAHCSIPGYCPPSHHLEFAFERSSISFRRHQSASSLASFTAIPSSAVAQELQATSPSTYYRIWTQPSLIGRRSSLTFPTLFSLRSTLTTDRIGSSELSTFFRIVRHLIIFTSTSTDTIAITLTLNTLSSASSYRSSTPTTNQHAASPKASGRRSAKAARYSRIAVRDVSATRTPRHPAYRPS